MLRDGRTVGAACPATADVRSGSGPRPRVALVTEGTYPCARGGVAVWCDQLIRNLPDLDFTVVAITPTGREPVVWDMPANLVDLRRRAAWDRIARRPRWRRTDELASPLHDLLLAIIDPPDADVRSQAARFSAALDRVVEMAAVGELERHLTFDAFIEPTRAALAGSAHVGERYEWSLADALAIATALPHLLSPLLVDVGPVDVVHASANGLPVLVGLAAQARRGTPLIMSEHGLYLRERYLGAGRELPRPVVKDVLLRFYRLLTVVAYRRCERLSPASGFNARWERALGARDEAVSTLHNGVDPETFPLRRTEIRSPDVVWLGRIDPVKDLHTLIRAADVVRHRVPDVRFRLFGEEPSDIRGYRDSCIELRDRLDLGTVLSFDGRVAHPTRAFHRGQISVLSSITEGFPYSVLESMSCGVPVVGTAVGGVPEAIADTGLIVPPRDHDAMAAAVVHMLTHPEERARMSQAARVRVERLYGLDQMLLGHDDLYRSLGGVIDLRDPPAPPARQGDDGLNGDRLGHGLDGTADVERGDVVVAGR